MPYRPSAPDRRNIKGVIYPFTAALLRVYGSRAQDAGRPIGAFYTKNVDRQLWEPVGGIWYRPLNEELILERAPDEAVVRAFARSIISGEPVTLPSGKVVQWEALLPSEASQLPPPLLAARDA